MVACREDSPAQIQTVENVKAMNDLGYQPPKSEKAEMPMSVGDSSKVQYPTLRFNGHQAEEAKLKGCKFGEEYEMMVRFKVTSIGGNSWEKDSEDKPAVECEVLSADDPREVESGEEEDKEPKRKPKQRVVGPDDDWKNEYK